MSEKEYHSNNFYIRRTCEDDRELFGEVAEAEYLFGRLYMIEPEIGIKAYWDTIKEMDINYSVFLKNGDFLGRVALQGGEDEVPELAITIVKQYQGQGYGGLLLKEWLNWIHSIMGYHRINIRIDRNNTRSVRMFQKMNVVVDEEDEIVCCHLDLPIS